MNFLSPIDLETIEKVDFYTTLHKGIRSALYRVSIALATVDPADKIAVMDALDQFHSVLKLMGKLGGVEATQIHGFLEASRPGATQAAEADSDRQALAVGALLRLEKDCRVTPVRQRAEILAQLNAGLTGFIGEALIHMADAELELMPLLREIGTAEELRALQRQIYADLGCDTVVAMVREIVQAVGPAELTQYLQAVQRLAPSAVWPAVWWAACAMLSKKEQDHFSEVLGTDCSTVPLGQGF